MLSHSEQLTVCLITCGEGTEAACRAALGPELGDVPLLEVRGARPQSAANNRALELAAGRYMLQVDSDMILYPGWRARVDRALKLHHHDRNWYQYLFWLWDSFTDRSIMAFKLVRTHLMLPYADVRLPDREHYDRTRRERPNLQIYGPDGPPIGEHRLLGPEVCYFKYKDFALSARHYDPGGARCLCDRERDLLRRRYLETGSPEYAYAVAGLIDGLRRDDPGSKRHGDRMRVSPADAFAEYDRC